MSELSTTRTIEINGESCTVTCVHKYPILWIATGIFDRKFIQQNGNSEESAFVNWENEAKSFISPLL